MELKKLTAENACRLRGRHLYLLRYFPDYIEELYTAHPSLPFIEGVLDSDPARHGEKAFHGNPFPVTGMDKLQELPDGSTLIITTGYFMEEYETLRKNTLPDTIDAVVYYFANQDTEYYESYLKKYAAAPLKDMIVFRSGMGTWEHVAGMDFTENARALFEYMLSQNYNHKYEMIWLVKHPERYRDIEQNNANVHFVSYDWATSTCGTERNAYYRAICLAKFFFFTHACGFCRLPREGQIRVQLWHGCGFKTVKNTTSQRGRYEYTTVVSRLYAHLHEKEFGLDSHQLMVTGYAKEDWLFHPVPDWKTRLKLPAAARYIFWLPTFRSAQNIVSYLDVNKPVNPSGLPVVGTMEELQEVSRLLQSRDTVLVIKLHPLQKKEDIFEGRFPNIVVLDNKTLAQADLHINQIYVLSGDNGTLIRGVTTEMRLQNTTLDEFVFRITERDQKIVVYGAGVIGKITLPMFMEDRQLNDHILFIADADTQKQREVVRIENRDIPICPPECLGSITESYAILITGSRYDAILRYLEHLTLQTEVDVYVFPQMLAKECRIFAKQKIIRNSETPMIPKIIHYCWFGGNTLPDKLEQCKASWSRFCPDYQIVEWNEGNYDIDKHLYTKQAYRHKKWGFIPDLARLEILYQHGGIYLDTDVELIRNLDELLYQPGFVGVEKWGIINIGGGCGVIPNHPAIRKMLEYRLSFPFERPDGSLNLESSGSYESKPMLDCGFRPDNTVQTVDNLTVYTSDFFHPFDYMSRELCVTENTYGIHHFTGSWV